MANAVFIVTAACPRDQHGHHQPREHREKAVSESADGLEDLRQVET